MWGFGGTHEASVAGAERARGEGNGVGEAEKMGRAGTMAVAAEVAGAGQLAVEEAVVFRGL